MDPELEGQTPAYMELANIKFALHLPEYRGNFELENKLMKGIVDGDMAPFYVKVCKDLGWVEDPELLARMEASNENKLSQYIEEKCQDNSSDDDFEPKIWFEKLLYLCSIGDSEAVIELATSKYLDKSLSVNRRLDAVFTLFRNAYFHGCNLQGMKDAVTKAAAMIESSGGGDWSARNKLKAYDAVCSLGFREYAKAARLFLDSLPTFESYELISFGNFVRYAILAAMIALPRCVLHENLTKQGVIPQALHAQLPDLKEYFASLYECRYADFFVSLAKIETDMRMDRLVHPHYRQYVREMRLRAYSQMLEAYRSLSLKRMAEAFGVTEEFVEKEVARFAATGRLQCKIDRVAGTVITRNYSADKTTSQVVLQAPAIDHNTGILYQSTIKRGDNLLNRLKKLAKVMDF